MAQNPPPGSAFTQSRAPTLKLVTVSSITSDGQTALVVDRTGVQYSVPMLTQPAKGVLPVVGENWYISNSSGLWNFNSFVGTSTSQFPSTGGGSGGGTTPGGPASSALAVYSYQGTPAAGNKPAAYVSTGTQDPYGNLLQALILASFGATSRTQVGLDGTVTFTDANGKVLGAIAPGTGGTYTEGISLFAMPLLVYSGVPAAGNLILSMAGQAGQDKFSNHYPQGFNFTAGSIPGSAITGTLPGSSTPIGAGGVLSYNSYFQNGDLTGWVAYPPGCTISPTQVPPGPYPWGVKLVSGSTGTASLQGQTFPFKILTNSPYQCSAWVYVNAAGNQTISIGMDFLNGPVAGINYVSTVVQSVTIPGNTWSPVTVVITSPPSGVSYGYPRCGPLTSTGAGMLTYIQAFTTLPQVPGALIQPGSLPSTAIKSLTASLIGNLGVLNANPYFQGGDPAGWSTNTGPGGVTSSPPAGAPYTYAFSLTSAGGGDAITESLGSFAVTPNSQVQVIGWLWTDATSGISVGLGLQDAGHNFTGSAMQAISPAASTWTPFATVQTIPGAGVSFAYPRVQDDQGSSHLYIQAVVCLPQVPGGLIQAGTITAAQIAAGSITAALIAANTITASQVIIGYDGQVALDFPQGWWKLDDPAGSSAAQDYSGNFHTGTPSNVTFQQQITAVSSVPSASFNGTTSRVVTAYTPPALTAFTVEAWVNLNSVAQISGFPQIISNSNTSGTNKGFELYFPGTAPYFPTINIGTGSTWAGYAVGAALPASGWTHLAVTYDGAHVVTYQNGVQQGSTALAVTVPADSVITIGTNIGNSANQMAGLLSEVAFYTTALSSARIAAHYNNRTGALLAQNIASDSITASQIAANTITAAEIKANTITAAQLAAGIVYAGIVDATTIRTATLISSVLLGYANSIARGPYFESFESGIGTWGAYGNAVTPVVDASWSSDGAQSLKITSAAVGAFAGASGQIACSPNDPISVKADFLSATNAYTGAGLQIDFYLSGVYQSSLPQNTGPFVPGVPQTLEVDGFAPPSNVDHYVIKAAVYDGGFPGGSTFNVDNVRGAGNLAFAASAFGGTDAQGNIFDQGIEINGVFGLQQAFSVQDAFGVGVLSAIDAMGNITGQTITANADVVMGGQSLTEQLYTDMGQGIIAYGSLDGNVPTPSSSGLFLEELDVLLAPNRTYRITATGMYITSTGAGTNVTAIIYYTTNGTQPTTSSAILAESYLNWSSGNRPMPDVSRIYRTGGSAVTIRMRLWLQGGGIVVNVLAGVPDADVGAIVVEDIGPSLANTGIYQGGGSTGGGTQTFTKSYNALSTHSYEGSDGGNANALMSTNGSATQGGDSFNTFNGKAKSWLLFPSSIASDLSGATVHWVKLQMVNQHSWFNDGMTVCVGWDTRTSFPSTLANPTTNSDLFEYHQNEGQNLTVKIDATGSSFGAAFKNSSARCIVLYKNSNDLKFYGYFAGGSSPTLTFNYTK